MNIPRMRVPNLFPKKIKHKKLFNLVLYTCTYTCTCLLITHVHVHVINVHNIIINRLTGRPMKTDEKCFSLTVSGTNSVGLSSDSTVSNTCGILQCISSKADTLVTELVRISYNS